MVKRKATLQQFEQAVQRLDDVLRQDKNEYIRDSAIQRFEFTFDLSWKLIKVYLEENLGIICRSPKGCFREAYTQNLIEFDNFWIEMTDMRNSTAHMYNETLAEGVYAKLPKTLQHFNTLLKAIRKETST
jgi:nucleotidyltransferase substrate binding protein (TIGR01987 family)